jgi:hypothetical protein
MTEFIEKAASRQQQEAPPRNISSPIVIHRIIPKLLNVIYMA